MNWRHYEKHSSTSLKVRLRHACMRHIWSSSRAVGAVVVAGGSARFWLRRYGKKRNHGPDDIIQNHLMVFQSSSSNLKIFHEMVLNKFWSAVDQKNTQ